MRQEDIDRAARLPRVRALLALDTTIDALKQRGGSPEHPNDVKKIIDEFADGNRALRLLQWPADFEALFDALYSGIDKETFVYLELAERAVFTLARSCEFGIRFSSSTTFERYVRLERARVDNAQWLYKRLLSATA